MKKNCDRLADIMKLINIMPLGSGALAGNPFNIDRIRLAKTLGFQDVTQNSMQAVGDRDFIGINIIKTILNDKTRNFQLNFYFGPRWLASI